MILKNIILDLLENKSRLKKHNQLRSRIENFTPPGQPNYSCSFQFGGSQLRWKCGCERTIMNKTHYNELCQTHLNQLK